MKRDMDLIRKLLFAIEENPREFMVDGYDSDIIKYHVLLLMEADYIDGRISNTLGHSSVAPQNVFVNRLTWNGHEFIDNIRQEEIWNTIKTEFKGASVSTIYSVCKQLAEGYAKKKIQVILGE